MTEIERLQHKLKQANDGYHKAVDGILLSDVIEVEHKCLIATKASTVFRLMEKILAFPLKEKT